jgi:ankyrin repeat protein
VQNLLRQGVDINAKGKDGYALLYGDAEEGYWEVVKYLIEKGKDSGY